MKIDFPYLYAVNYKEPRQARWSHAAISAEMAMDLTEIADEDAPVVHVVRDSSQTVYGKYDSEKTQVSKFHVPGGDCLIRLHEGQYYASRFPVEDIATWRGNSEFDPFAMTVAFRGGESEHANRMTTRIKGDERAVTLQEFGKANPNAKKFTSERDVTERYIAMFSKQFAVIDGMLFEKVNEPVVTLLMSGRGGDVSVYIEEALSPSLSRFKKGYWRGEPGGRIRFGLDEYDRALGVAQAWSKRNEARVAVHGEVLSAESSVVRFRGDHEYVFSAAHSAVEQFKKAIVYMPERVGVAVAKAANLMAVHDRMTPASLDAVRAMYSELSAYFEGDHAAPEARGNIYEHYDHDVYERRNAFGENWRWTMSRLGDAISHWDSRDDVGLEWFDAALDALPMYDYPSRAYEVTSQFDLDKVAMKWKGGLPLGLSGVDPSVSAIVVVEDFEDRIPLAAVVYDRHDLSAEPAVFGNPDPAAVDKEVALAAAYVAGARQKADMALAYSAPAFGA